MTPKESMRLIKTITPYMFANLYLHIASMKPKNYTSHPFLRLLRLEEIALDLPRLLNEN